MFSRFEVVSDGLSKDLEERRYCHKKVSINVDVIP